MGSKLKQSSVQQYSRLFTEKALKSFYTINTFASGEQLMKFTSSPQVNLFIIKNLFEVWKEESFKQRSPFFDYNQQKVKEAHANYMNVLSRHIAVREENLRPLVEQAVEDTLYLIFSPKTYFVQELDKLFEVRVEKLRERFKYLRINKNFADQVLRLVEEDKYKHKPSILDAIKELPTETEDPAKYIHHFSNVLELNVDDIVEKTEEPIVKEPEYEEESDFFSTITSELDETPSHTEEKTGFHSFTHAEQAQRASTQERQELNINAVNRRQEPPSSSGNVDNERKSLNERLSKENVSLNDRLSQKQERQTLGETLQKKKTSSIRNSISLNQRFMFTSELFLGDTQAFMQALDKLDHLESFSEAQNLLMQLGVRYKWKQDSEAREEFTEIVKNKYN